MNAMAPAQCSGLGRRDPVKAHLLPLVVFMAVGLGADWGGFGSDSKLWVYPLQAIAGLALIGFYWPAFEFRPWRGWLLILLTAPLAWAAWLAPSWIYRHYGAPAWMDLPVPMMEIPLRTVCGLTDRTDGFDPNAYAGTMLPVWAGVALRFLRLVVTVPLVEEVCWRGFVMRQVDDPGRSFAENPFGRHRWRTYGIVTALVVLVHQPMDWFGALVFGSLAYFIAVRTKSLGACVIFHAAVNLLLGISVMLTSQWGFW